MVASMRSQETTRLVRRAVTRASKETISRFSATIFLLASLLAEGACEELVLGRAFRQS